MRPARLRDCPKGEFIRLKPDSKQTYRRGDYCKTSKRFSLINCDDTNREAFRAGCTTVFIGFTY
jgi:hypothetical protein